MRKLFLALIFFGAALSTSSSFAEDQRNVTVVNGTGYGIKFLGFNNPSDDDWSDSELPPNSVLPNGNSVYCEVQHVRQRLQMEFQDRMGGSGLPWRGVERHRSVPGHHRDVEVRPFNRHDHRRPAVIA
jgi:hypothetical protein